MADKIRTLQAPRVNQDLSQGWRGSKLQNLTILQLCCIRRGRMCNSQIISVLACSDIRIRNASSYVNQELELAKTPQT